MTNRRANYVVVLMLLPWPVQAQPLPPDQACATIVRTLDDATGHRDSNREALRRALIACRLFATGTPSPAAPADPLADIEPNPRGITRVEVEAAIAVRLCGKAAFRTGHLVVAAAGDVSLAMPRY